MCGKKRLTRLEAQEIVLTEAGLLRPNQGELDWDAVDRYLSEQYGYTPQQIGCLTVPETLSLLPKQSGYSQAEGVGIFKNLQTLTPKQLARIGELIQGY